MSICSPQDPRVPEGRAAAAEHPAAELSRSGGVPAPRGSLSRAHMPFGLILPVRFSLRCSRNQIYLWTTVSSLGRSAATMAFIFAFRGSSMILQALLTSIRLDVHADLQRPALCGSHVVSAFSRRDMVRHISRLRQPQTRVIFPYPDYGVSFIYVRCRPVRHILSSAKQNFLHCKTHRKLWLPVRFVAQKEGFEPSRRFYPAYSLSRGAPSASWVLLQIHIKFGGESGIRTHGDLRLAGFQDRFLQPLGHLSIAERRPHPKHLKHDNTFAFRLSTLDLFFRPRNFFNFFDLGLAFPGKACYYKQAASGCSAVGSALDWGSRGREFKSRHSDHAEYH